MNELNFPAMRAAMVDSQLRTNSVTQPAIVAALMTVPREQFVPDAHRARAYADAPVPLGRGRSLNPPLTTARLIAESGLSAAHNVLVIGAATGYACAVIGALAATVVGVEGDAALAAQAREALADRQNVTIADGQLQNGCPDHAPFDVIIIDGAVERIPAAIVAQLSDTGRIVGVVNDDGVMRMVRGMRAGDGLSLISFADTDAVPLPGFAPEPVFSF